MLHIVVELLDRRTSGGLFAQLSLDVDGRVMLACSHRLILLVGPIYDHLHAAACRSGNEGGFIAIIGSQFYGLDAARFGRATNDINHCER